jgi:hypothetical protein
MLASDSTALRVLHQRMLASEFNVVNHVGI